MSDCKVFRTQIEEAADGSALGREAASHVESCAACGEELRGRATLRGLVRGLGRVEAPPDFEYRLRARMAGSKPGGGQGIFASWFPVGGLAWAAAAVCVLSVTAAIYFKQAQPARRDATNAGEVASVPQANASPSVIQSKSAGETQAQQTKTGESADINKTAVSSSATASRIQKVAATKRSEPQPRERKFVERASSGDSTHVGAFEFSVGSAPNRVPQLNGGNGSTSRVSVQGIQLGTSAGTLRVTLLDERGTLVPMRTVSFGSQEPLSKQTASGRTTTKDEEGIW